ncbi:hypothetical protein E4T43_01987 [Aureobasidium subglaciale]|nr:hypothetical protein E4T43_01987 [Aureobasidium subglaciale]
MSTDKRPAESEQTLNATPTTAVGCVECRTRRLYCETDAADPRQACGSCVRNGYICSNLTSTVATPRPRATPRNRVQKVKAVTRVACNWCRRQKVRCSDGTPCGACAIRDQPCIYPAVNRKLPNDGSSATSGDWEAGLPRYDLPGHDQMNASPTSSLQPGQIYHAPAPLPRQHARKTVSQTIKQNFSLGLDKQVVAEYIEAFFRFVYPVGCMSFLHQATFLRQWHTYTLDLSLLRVVCGSALRVFSTTQEDNERAAQWLQEAELDVLQNLGDLTISRLQTLTLLAFFEFTYHVHSPKALMLLGLAARLAFAKRLNHEDDSLSVVEQESRRRLMWAVFVLDKLCSGGVTELTLVSAEHMEIRLPTIEKAFGFGQRTDTEVLRPQLIDGVPITNAKGMDEFAYTIRLLDLLRNKIHKFAKRVTSKDENLYSSAQEFLALDSAIDTIDQQIPADLRWDKTNLQKRMYAPGLSSYIMLHTWRLQCKLDLHRLTVSGTRECISEAALLDTPLNFAQNLRLKCLSHAVELTKMWSEVLGLGLAKPVHDPAISGCAHQCAKILTLIPEQVGYSAPGQENRVGAVLICQMILEPLKDIYPKAKILYDDVCRMRSELNCATVQDFPNTIHQNGISEQNLGVTMHVNNEDQVRSLLNQYNG